MASVHLPFHYQLSNSEKYMAVISKIRLGTTNYDLRDAALASKISTLTSSISSLEQNTADIDTIRSKAESGYKGYVLASSLGTIHGPVMHLLFCENSQYSESQLISQMKISNRTMVAVEVSRLLGIISGAAKSNNLAILPAVVTVEVQYFSNAFFTSNLVMVMADLCAAEGIQFELWTQVDGSAPYAIVNNLLGFSEAQNVYVVHTDGLSDGRWQHYSISKMFDRTVRIVVEDYKVYSIR